MSIDDINNGCMNNNQNKKRNHIVKLAQAGGVGLFLIAGLSGCEDKSDCIKNAQYAPDVKKALEECQDKRVVGSSGLLW